MTTTFSLERSIELSEEHARVVCRNLTVFDGQYGLGLNRTTVNITSSSSLLSFSTTVRQIYGPASRLC